MGPMPVVWESCTHAYDYGVLQEQAQETQNLAVGTHAHHYAWCMVRSVCWEL